MAIGSAIQKYPNQVYVYSDKNAQLFIQTGELHGYTSSQVNIKRGNTIYSFDEKGHQTGCRCC